MWKTARSAQRPQETDNTSSKTVAYIRKNIEEKTDTEGNIFYEYQEKTMSKDAFSVLEELMPLIEENSDALETIIIDSLGGEQNV